MRSARIERALDAQGAADVLLRVASHAEQGWRATLVACGARPTHVPCAVEYADEIAEIRLAVRVLDQAEDRARRTRRTERAWDLEEQARAMRAVLAWYR